MKKYYFQQGQPDWFAHKMGKVTGTVLADICGTAYKRDGALHEIISERLTPILDVEHMNENSISRGLRLEQQARDAFTFVTGKNIEQAGFCESDENPLIGYSPDGLIGETEDIEIKCPEGKNYMKIVLSNEVPKEYVWQIVQGFVVNPKLQIRYFVAYNPDIPSYPIHIIECNRSDYTDDIAKALDEQKKFLAEVDDKLASLNL